MSHLENIATRQRKSLVRDILFVSKAVQASSIVAHR
jgi:hypothetical protein